MKTPASAPLVIQNFRPVSSHRLPFCSARVARAKASLPLPGSDRANAPSRSLVSLRKVVPMLLGCAPTKDRVVDERVVHVHVDGGRRIDSRDLLDGERRQKNPSTRAAVLLRNFDAHEPELEESSESAQAGIGPPRPFRARAASRRSRRTRGPHPGTWSSSSDRVVRADGAVRRSCMRWAPGRPGRQVDGVYACRTSSATGTRPSGADTCAP